MRRVVVTGIGVVSPLGIGLAATADAYSAGASGIGTNTQFDSAAFGQPLAGMVPPYDVRALFRVPKALKLCDRRTRLAVSAGALSLAHAGLDRAGPAILEGAGVVLGTSGSDLGVPDVVHALEGVAPGDTMEIGTFGARMLDRLNPLWLLVNLPNMASAHVAIQFGARGPNSTVMTGDAAGLQAIGEAADLVRAGEADVMLAGAADTGIMPFVYAAVAASGEWPAGFVPAEAAVMLVLEDRARALARGATAHGEVVRFECSRREGAPRSTAAVKAAARNARQPGPEWDDVDVTPLTGYAFSAAAPLSLACAVAGGRHTRIVAEARDRGGVTALVEMVM